MTPSHHDDHEDRSVLTRKQAEPQLTLNYGNHADQIAEVFPSTTPPSTWAIGIHGGFWRPAFDRTHLRNTAAALAAHGVLSILIEYRRIPGQPQVMVEDVCLAVQSLQSTPGPLYVPNSRPVLWGHSAGGHLALLVGQLMPLEVSRAIALAPVTDLVQAEIDHLGKGAVAEFLGGRAVDFAQFDPARLAEPELPVTLIHGARDSLVPIRQSMSLAGYWTSADCITIPDSGHFELIDPHSAAWPTVLSAIAN